MVTPNDVDPLLKDLSERKQSFRRNVVSLAAELKEVRGRLALQTHSSAKETLTRQEVEAKAKSMAEEISMLQKSLEERNEKLQASNSAAEKYLADLDSLRSHLTVAQATSDASVASAESAQLQCLALVKELDSKNNSFKEQEDRIKRMEEQLGNLQNDLQSREFSQKQLKDEVVRVEHDIMLALAKAGLNKDCELRKLLDDVSPKNLEQMNRLLTEKDEEIGRLRDEIKILSAHWRFKTKELESKLEKHKGLNQELKKRVLKLEFCLQEARSQTRKLARMGERRDEAIKDLQDQLAMKPQQHTSGCCEKQSFWESSSFKAMVSMSMLVLVLLSDDPFKNLSTQGNYHTCLMASKPDLSSSMKAKYGYENQ
ncbi:hypothetical protein V2J09_007813 [Rumex salicifolius]